MQKLGRNCYTSAVFCPALAAQYSDPDEIKPVSIAHCSMSNLAHAGDFAVACHAYGL